MGASPEQLEREIEQTRTELAHTIGQIEERVSRLKPSNVAREHRTLLLGVGGGVAALIALLVVWRRR